MVLPSVHQPFSRRPRYGFVVAMRAKLSIEEGAVWREWIIAARWGTEGNYLSIARTFLPAPPARSAPIELVPRETALATVLRLPPISATETFLLARWPLFEVSLAGDFVPAEGFVQLRARGAVIGLRAEGRCIHGTRLAWRAEAVRVPWIGDFIEEAPRTEES